jgi:hypothetical protein
MPSDGTKVGGDSKRRRLEEVCPSYTRAINGRPNMSRRSDYTSLDSLKTFRNTATYLDPTDPVASGTDYDGSKIDCGGGE